MTPPPITTTSAVRPASGMRRKLALPGALAPSRAHCLRKPAGLALGRNLVERRVGDLVTLYLGSALDDLIHALQYARVRAARVRLGALLLVPETDGDRPLAILGHKRQLVLEAVLFAQHREDVVLEGPGKLGARAGLQVNREISCVHVSS